MGSVLLRLVYDICHWSIGELLILILNMTRICGVRLCLYSFPKGKECLVLFMKYIYYEFLLLQQGLKNA